MIFDLHVHSSASDGTLSPEELVSEAASKGLGGIALTDHDTLDGLRPALEKIQQEQLNITFVPGIEMNCEFDEEEIHILGYFVNEQNPSLIERLREIRTLRSKRAEKMVEKLSCIGLDIAFETVKKYAKGDLVGRPHIARALMDRGYVGSMTEAFAEYLAVGKPAYVPRYKFLPDEAIGLIKESGGIAVLAHPGLIKSQQYVQQVISWGIEGIEVYYPQHSMQDMKRYHLIAIENTLLITGGSDFHGPGSSESRNKLGACGVDQKGIQTLFGYRFKKNNNMQ